MQGPGGGLGEGGIAAVYPPGQRAQGQGLDPAFLAVQLRKLQKKQKGALRELQAAAGREAFWKQTAHSAEHALDEVSLLLFDDMSTTCMSHYGRFCCCLEQCIQQELCLWKINIAYPAQHTIHLTSVIVCKETAI